MLQRYKKAKLLSSLGFFLGLMSFNITADEKPFVVTIPSYNTKAWYERNLDSLFAQEYSNYRVIYVDDCSTDGNDQLVKAYIERSGHAHRVTFIRNEKNVGAMANLYTMIHSCKDDEIIVNLDGDDWFPHPYVLQRLNQEYSDSNLWLTFGQMVVHPSGDIGCSKPIIWEDKGHSSIRGQCGHASHLRSYYAWLFKQVKLVDMFYEGLFFPATYDWAMMAPMLEMSAGHFKYLNDVLYCYNHTNPLSDFRIRSKLQEYLGNLVLNKPSYPWLSAPQYHERSFKNQIIVISEDSPTKLSTMITNLCDHVKGINTINILYKASTSEAIRNYENIKRWLERSRKKNVDIITFTSFSTDTFTTVLSTCLNKSDCTYVALFNDKIHFIAPCDFNECAKRVDQVFGHSFHFYADQTTVKRVNSLSDDFGVYQFAYDPHPLLSPFNPEQRKTIHQLYTQQAYLAHQEQSERKSHSRPIRPYSHHREARIVQARQAHFRNQPIFGRQPIPNQKLQLFAALYPKNILQKALDEFPTHSLDEFKASFEETTFEQDLLAVFYKQKCVI